MPPSTITSGVTSRRGGVEQWPRWPVGRSFSAQRRGIRWVADTAPFRSRVLYPRPMQQSMAETDRMTFTPAGAEKASQILKSSGKPDAAIRVFVKSGGCSGYQYGMQIDDRRLDGDRVFEVGDVKLVVDERSWPLVRGSQVDYVENMMGGGFNLSNPNASSECGCGHSFRTDGAAAPAGEGASCS